jgi:hypothetical protein
MAEATQPGAEQQQPNEEYVNPRDAILESMEEKIQAEREGQIAEYNAQVREEQELEVRPPDPPPPPAADGAAERAPMHEPPPAAPGLPEHLADDPLAEYIVMHEGRPMFKAKIEGQDMLIPLDRAKQQIQKHEAAEVRLQNATEMQRQLTAREEIIRQNEAALQARMEQATQAPPSQPPAEDVDEDALHAEAKNIVSQLFTADEDTAADKLATFLIDRTRTPTAAPAAAAAPIDQNAIAEQAAQTAMQRITKAERDRDIKGGYQAFQKDYPEIMADANLYGMADNMTDVIEKEHPDWLPSQVMLESGKRTRAWVDQMKGVTTPEPQIPSDDQRQQRKEDLVPIPAPAASSQQQSYVESDEEAQQTPQEILAEYRTHRGQAT